MNDTTVYCANCGSDEFDSTGRCVSCGWDMKKELDKARAEYQATGGIPFDEVQGT
jgi:ribosomal protein L37E